MHWIELNCWQYHGDESSNNVSVTTTTSTTTITIQPLLYLSIPTYKKTLHHHHHHHLCIHAQFYLCGITYFCIRIFYVFLCRFLIFLTYIWWWWPVYFFSLEEGRKEERKEERKKNLGITLVFPFIYINRTRTPKKYFIIIWER